MKARRLFIPVTQNGLDLHCVRTVSYTHLTAGKNVGAGASNYGMVSYFGKVNYDYEGRYLASVTVRRDASSRLAKGNNVDYFPSVSALSLIHI